MGRKTSSRINKGMNPCPVKNYPGVRPTVKQNVPRSLMFSRLFMEVKKDFAEKMGDATTKHLAPRRERRHRALSLARKTMHMMREKGAHKAA